MDTRQVNGALSGRARRDADLRPDIQRVWDENFRVYGVRKVWRQLNREGIAVARCTVAGLMSGMGLAGVLRGKAHGKTIPDPLAPCPQDRVNRVFHAPSPNMPWLSDFTYVATFGGCIYVAFVIDAFARRIAGWRVSRSMQAEFVLDALGHALIYDWRHIVIADSLFARRRAARPNVVMN